MMRMHMQYLDFEKPLNELEDKINALSRSDVKNASIQTEIDNMKLRSTELMKKIYGSLSDWQITQLARHPERPYFLDLLNRIFTDFQELHGDRTFGDDKAVITGIAKLNEQPVMVIGQEKGRKTNAKILHNFGMMHPEGYRKALRLMKLAEKFSIPIVTFIDTPGAYPGIDAERRGQSEAIARNLFEMAQLNVPIICIIIGEGCSGGALGIGVGDELMMLEYSYFATISPEGCASILWKTSEKAADAAKIMGITAKRLKDLNIIDTIIKEPLGGAHRNFDQASSNIKNSLCKSLNKLLHLDNKTLKETRYQKLMQFGIFN